MKLGKAQKILLGIASGWPVVYIFLFFALIFGMIVLLPGGGGELDPIFRDGFAVLMVVHMLTIVLSLGLTVLYIVHVVKNTRLDGNMRIIWILLLLFGGMIAGPVYWYLQIWKEPKTDISQLPPPPPSSWADQNEVRQGSYVPPGEPPDWR